MNILPPFTSISENNCWLFLSFQCAVSGVIYLQSMLSIRSPLVLEEYNDTDIKDPGAVNLLKEGLCLFFIFYFIIFFSIL